MLFKILLKYLNAKANLAILKKKFLQNNPIRLGRGIVFHIAPANVPVNFAFSLCFGLIAGNSNVVRVSSKYMPQVDIICAVINTLLKKKGSEKLKLKSRLFGVLALFPIKYLNLAKLFIGNSDD